MFNKVTEKQAMIMIIIVLIIGMIAMAIAISPTQTIDTHQKQEVVMTVDEFVSLPGDFYFIVKAEGDFGVLESDAYMDREVVEVAVCEDTENTICLFIQLEENEEPHYRKVY